MGSQLALWAFVGCGTRHARWSWKERPTEESTRTPPHRGYAGKTLRNEATTLVQAHKWLIEEKYLAGVELLRLKLRKVESQRAYCYTREQVDAMITHCRGHASLLWLVDVIIALACTGLRISELASLRWTDVDKKHGLLTLTDESGKAEKLGSTRRELKSGRSRSLPIHPSFDAVLAKMPRTDAYVFHGPRGGRLKPDTVRNALVREVIKPLSKRFADCTDGEREFSEGRVHGFRHYFASTCANNGTPERVVMQWLGHADSEMVRH